MDRTSPVFPRDLRRLALAAALAACLPQLAWAESSDARSLDRVTVTGTRASTAGETLAASTVITREDIERLAPASLPELLDGQPGLAIYQQGGMGKLSGLYLRGTGPGQVLVLVDGVKIGSPSAGMPALQDIPVAQIERIEIVRGPMSSLYGSEAVGGVIQIFTRRAEGEGVRPSFGLAYGSRGTLRSDAGLAARHGRGWYSATLAHEETDGFNACNGDPVTFAGCGTFEPDRDGYRNTSAQLAGGLRISPQWEVDARALRAEGRNDFDGGWANRSRIVQQVLGAHVAWKPSETVAVHAQLGRNDDDSRNYTATGVQAGRITTQRDTGSLKADFGSEASRFSVGYDWQRDGVASSTPLDRDSRLSRALFGQWLGGFGDHRLQIGARREDNEQFGAATTGNVIWGWSLAEDLRLTASWGSAFRAPTFNDLYYPGFSNPDLQPERSRSVELGVEGRAAALDWSLRAYQTRLHDLIVYNPGRTSPTSPWGMPDNIQNARIRGLEAVFGVDVAGWDLAATASWIDPRNITPGVLDGNLLNRRPQRMARLDADRDFGRWRVGASVSGNSHRYDDPANTLRLGGYATTDLRVGWRQSDALSWQLTASNVFDKRYETAAWYNMAGRTLMLGLRWQPGR